MVRDQDKDGINVSKGGRIRVMGQRLSIEEKRKVPDINEVLFCVLETVHQVKFVYSIYFGKKKLFNEKNFVLSLVHLRNGVLEMMKDNRRLIRLGLHEIKVKSCEERY